VTLNFTEEDQWGTENVELCTMAAIIPASNRSHVALSQHMLSFLLFFPVIRQYPLLRHYRDTVISLNCDKFHDFLFT